MNIIIRFTLVLFFVNLISVSILVGVSYVTGPIIEGEKKLAEKSALIEVMPAEIGEDFKPVEDDAGNIRYWEVFKKGSGYNASGYVFIAKRYGYCSVIETIVGMERDGTITGVRILSQNETPGLGAKIIEVMSDKTVFKALEELFFKDKDSEGMGKDREKVLGVPYFTEQFNGLNIRKLELSKKGIHAITGATISSKAVLDSVRQKGLMILESR